MKSDAYRWQAAMGAIVGSLVAGSRAAGETAWTADGVRSIAYGERVLRGEAVPVDLTVAHAVPAAVGLATTATPLLADPATVGLIDVVRAKLGGRSLEAEPVRGEPMIDAAVELARRSGFDEVIAGAGPDHDLAGVAGALHGLEGGIGVLPARLVAETTSPDGRRGRRFLSGLTARLLGIDRTELYDPRRRRGPREVLPGLWLANLLGVGRFTADHPEGLVLSLCDDEGRVDARDHLVFHLEDTPTAAVNPHLPSVLDEVLAEIGQARARNRPVLVHCRHGASRTGLVLRLLLADDLGLDADDALTEAQCLWPHTSSWNTAWNREVQRRVAGRQPNR